MAVWEPVQKIWQHGCTQNGWMYAVDDQWHGLRAIGYCMSWEDRVKRAQADIAKYGSGQQDLLDRCRPFEHNFHEAPHHTRVEAIECYRNYLFDLHVQLHWYTRAKHMECDLCGKPSSFGASILGTSTQSEPIFLCDPHSAREDIRKGFYKAFWIGDVTNLGPVRPNPQSCTCPSRSLLNNGCQCGGN